MADLNTPKATLILARLNLSIEQQRLVIEQRDLRLSEVGDERRNVQADIANLESRKADIAAKRPKLDKTATEYKRTLVQEHELAVLVQGRQIRLLELDEEDEQVATDIAASNTLIAKLEAEVSQQKKLLAEKNSG